MMKQAVLESLINDQTYVQYMLIRSLNDYIVKYGWDTQSDKEDHVDLNVIYKCGSEFNMQYDIKRATYTNRYKNWSLPTHVDYTKCDEHQYFIFIQDDETSSTYANIYIIRRNLIHNYIIKSNDLYMVIDKDRLISSINAGPENFWSDMWSITAFPNEKYLLQMLTNKKV